MHTPEAGNRPGMTPPRRWSVNARVRADEDSMFVRQDLLAHAQPGDVIDVVSDELPATRSGRVVAAQRDPSTGDFWIVHLDTPN